MSCFKISRAKYLKSVTATTNDKYTQSAQTDVALYFFICSCKMLSIHNPTFGFMRRLMVTSRDLHTICSGLHTSLTTRHELVWDILTFVSCCSDSPPAGCSPSIARWNVLVVLSSSSPPCVFTHLLMRSHQFPSASTSRSLFLIMSMAASLREGRLRFLWK